MANSVEPDQIASVLSGSTLFTKAYLPKDNMVKHWFIQMYNNKRIITQICHGYSSSNFTSTCISNTAFHNNIIKS